MKKVYMIVLALFFAVPMLAQEKTEKAEKAEKKEDIHVWCIMPGGSGQWLKLSEPTKKVVTDFQDKLIYLEILNPYDITEKGKLDRATSDAILKMEKRKGVTYDSKELVGFTQGMKNRLNLLYYTAKRAAEQKEKQ